MEAWLQEQSILFLPKEQGALHTFIRLLPTPYPLFISTQAGLQSAWEAMNSLSNRDPMFRAIKLAQGSVFIATGIASGQTAEEWQQLLQNSTPDTHAALLQLTRRKREREVAPGGGDDQANTPMEGVNTSEGEGPPTRDPNPSE